jgi:hypothetical protein
VCDPSPGAGPSLAACHVTMPWPGASERPPVTNDDAHAPALAAVEEQFPCFRIWREVTCERARYVSLSLHLRLNPHTVMTDDLAELRTALEPARHLPCPEPHPPGQHPHQAAPKLARRSAIAP